jgi:hypothetical protein
LLLDRTHDRAEVRRPLELDLGNDIECLSHIQ